MTTHERELTDPVDLCLPDGRLNPEAVGWSRRPLHRCALPGGWGRNKRWDYWCFVAEPHVVQLTVLHADFLGMVSAVVLDTSTGDAAEHLDVRPLGAGMTLGDRVDGVISVRWPRTRLTFWGAGRRHLELVTPSLGLAMTVEPGADSLNVVVPWSDRRFQFTSKQLARPARARITTAGRSVEHVGHATLDFGRGRWPRRTRWNWLAVAGPRVAVQLGGQWTDGTGSTENGVFLDGVLHKIGDALRFAYDPARPGAPWSIGAPDIADLTFTPTCFRPLRVPGIARLDLCFGHLDGWVRAADRRVAVDHLFGWTEDMDVSW